MREIKFRAWKKYTKEMLTDTSNFTHDDFSRKGFVFMQYTGLHDRNGKEIYEGDVVKGNDQFVEKVVYIAPSFWSTEDGKTFRVKLDEWREIEIIGNIYEHGNLLK